MQKTKLLSTSYFSNVRVFGGKSHPGGADRGDARTANIRSSSSSAATTSLLILTHTNTHNMHIMYINIYILLFLNTTFDTRCFSNIYRRVNFKSLHCFWVNDALKSSLTQKHLAQNLMTPSSLLICSCIVDDVDFVFPWRLELQPPSAGKRPGGGL